MSYVLICVWRFIREWHHAFTFGASWLKSLVVYSAYLIGALGLRFALTDEVTVLRGQSLEDPLLAVSLGALVSVGLLTVLGFVSAGYALARFRPVVLWVDDELPFDKEHAWFRLRVRNDGWATANVRAKITRLCGAQQEQLLSSSLFPIDLAWSLFNTVEYELLPEHDHTIGVFHIPTTGTHLHICWVERIERQALRWGTAWVLIVVYARGCPQIAKWFHFEPDKSQPSGFRVIRKDPPSASTSST